MRFKNRTEAGKKLAHALRVYRGKNVVVYGLPRGGVVVAYEIAKYLHAPLDLLSVCKIGHPDSPERSAKTADFIQQRKRLHIRFALKPLQMK